MNQLTLRGPFGCRYRLLGYHDGPTPKDLKPLSFTDIETAFRFIRRLHAPQGYWDRLAAPLSRAPLAKTSQSEANQRCVARALVYGRIRLYPLTKVDAEKHPPHKRALRSQEGLLYRFEPSEVLLTQRDVDTQAFSDENDVFQLIESLDPSEQELQELIEASPSITAPPALSEAARPAMIQAVAKSVLEGKILVLKQRPFQKTREGTEMELAPLPAQKPVPLASPTVSTWVEIKLLDDQDEPIANEPYLIIDSDGVEHTGTTDGQGSARLPKIAPGNCYVSFPEQDGPILKG